MSQTPSQELQDSQRKEREHFFGSAKVVAGLTLLSRIAGLGRAMAISTMGASVWMDAFLLAFKIPNLFRRLFAEGALSAVFVPVMTETLEEGPEGQAKALRLLANAMGILAVVLLGLMLLGQAIALVWAFWPRLGGGAVPADTQLMLLLTSIMLPFMVTICLLALASAALNCRGHFWYPAATPIILNLVIIAAAWWVAPIWKQDVSQQLVVVAASVTVAGAIQLAGVLWLLHRTGFSLRWRLRPVEPGIGPMVRRMAPMLMGLGFLQLSELFQTILAWWLRYDKSAPTVALFGWTLTKPLQPGVLLPIENARYLYQFPMGVLAISLGVAVFPLLSRYAIRGDLPNLRGSINRALRLAFMEGMATGVGLYILAEPISWILFRHKKFTAEEARVTAFIVRMYVMGMWSYCTYQIVVRAFYALKDVKTPLVVSCVLAVFNLLTVGTMVFIPNLGAGAFGVSMTLTFAINVIVLALLLRKRVGLLGGRKMAVSFARTIAACLVMAAALFWLLAEMTGQEQAVIPGVLSIGPLLPPSLGLGHFSNLAIVGITVPAGALVFILSAWAMRAPELGELLGPIAERLRKKKEKM